MDERASGVGLSEGCIAPLVRVLEELMESVLEGCARKGKECAKIERAYLGVEHRDVCGVGWACGGQRRGECGIKTGWGMIVEAEDETVIDVDSAKSEAEANSDSI